MFLPIGEACGSAKNTFFLCCEKVNDSANFVPKGNFLLQSIYYLKSQNKKYFWFKECRHGDLQGNSAVRTMVNKFGDGSQLTEPLKPKLDSCMSARPERHRPA
ncbi:MAG: hypothetical protein ACJ8G3_06500 [Burkholderiaceae bacterium]